MTYEKEPSEVFERFSWVGNDAIKIINEEGLEKIIYIATDEYR
jgi:hypothetical protein